MRGHRCASVFGQVGTSDTGIRVDSSIRAKGSELLELNASKLKYEQFSLLK